MFIVFWDYDDGQRVQSKEKDFTSLADAKLFIDTVIKTMRYVSWSLIESTTTLIDKGTIL